MQRANKIEVLRGSKMFKWLNRKKDNEIKKTDEIVADKAEIRDNYKIEKDGNIKIRAEIRPISWCGVYKSNITIKESSIISHTNNSIVFKDYRNYFNFKSDFYFEVVHESIENKKNLIEYKDTQIKTYEYFKKDECWKHTKTDVVGTEIVSERTPLEIFNKNFKSKYRLIETEDELNEYLSSSLDCDTWCRKKLYDKMKELGLGDGFINQFADLIGNDLNKYHAMIELANEVTDKDTLMYLYTYKFSK